MKFDEPITNHKAVQDAITITTEPKVEGAFYWVSPQDVRWRPAEFWKPGTKVSVAVRCSARTSATACTPEEREVDVPHRPADAHHRR